MKDLDLKLIKKKINKMYFDCILEKIIEQYIEHAKSKEGISNTKIIIEYESLFDLLYITNWTKFTSDEIDKNNYWKKEYENITHGREDKCKFVKNTNNCFENAPEGCEFFYTLLKKQFGEDITDFGIYEWQYYD